jgi:hypothetical protein
VSRPAPPGAGCFRSSTFAQAGVPFAGFALIEARDLGEVVDLVSKTPWARAKGAVEIWPIRELGLS